MLRLHSYILWSMLKFFHKKSQHYILCMIYIYKRGGTHIVQYIQFFFQKRILQKVSEMLRLHSYILWSMLKFFHIKSQHYILCMRYIYLYIYISIYIYIYIYIYISGGRHTYSCMYSSFVQCQTYSRFNLVLFRCKKSRNLFSIFIIFST
jgi:hypothetical protein